MPTREICYIVEATADGGSVFLVDMSVAAIRTDRFEYANLNRGTFQQKFSVSEGVGHPEDVFVNGAPIVRYDEKFQTVYVAICQSARYAKKLAADRSAELKAYSDHFVAARETVPSGSPSI